MATTAPWSGSARPCGGGDRRVLRSGRGRRVHLRAAAGRATSSRLPWRPKSCAAAWTWGGAAHCYVAGGHSIDDPEPKYGMAVTGIADPAALLRIDAGQPGLPLTLTKPIGTGVLNAWHKATGQVSAAAIEVMTTLNADASRRALAAGIRCATDVTGV